MRYAADLQTRAAQIRRVLHPPQPRTTLVDQDKAESHRWIRAALRILTAEQLRKIS